MKNTEDWGYLGPKPEPKEDEAFHKFLIGIDMFLERLLQKHQIQYIKCYVGKALYGDNRYIKDQFIVLVVISPEENGSQRQLDAYRTEDEVKGVLEKATNNSVSISYTDGENLDEEAIAGDGFFYKKNFNKQSSKKLSPLTLHRRFSMMLDPDGRNYCRECGGICGNSKHGR